MIRHAGIKFTIFLTVTGLTTLFLALVLADHRGGGDPREYALELSDASMLTSGSPVRIAGVDVGRVGAVEYRGPDRIHVSFSADGSTALPRNVLAAVRYKNLVGDRYLELIEPKGPEGRLSEGATIPMSRTKPAVNIDELVGGFKPLLSALDADQVNQLSGSLVAVLNGQDQAVARLLDDVATVTSTITDQEAVIDRLLVNLTTTLDTVNRRSDTLSTLLVDTRRLVSGLSRDRDPLVQAVVRLERLTAESADLLGRVRPDLKPLLRSARAVASGVNNDQGKVDAFLRDLGDAYDAISGIGVYGDFFNFFLCDVRVRTGVEGATVETPWVNSDVPRCTGEPTKEKP